MNGGDSCTIVWVYLIPLNCVLKMVKTVNFMCILPHLKIISKKIKWGLKLKKNLK